jgi:hypothetical protein
VPPTDAISATATNVRNASIHARTTNSLITQIVYRGLCHADPITDRRCTGNATAG